MKKLTRDEFKAWMDEPDKHEFLSSFTFNDNEYIIESVVTVESQGIKAAGGNLAEAFRNWSQCWVRERIKHEG